MAVVSRAAETGMVLFPAAVPTSAPIKDSPKNTLSPSPLRNLADKVPEVTLIFWIIKMMPTTVGETAADFLNADMGFGPAGTSVVVGLLLAVILFFQVRALRCVPALCWSTVVFVSVVATLVTDNLGDVWGVPLAVSIEVFSVLLMAVFGIWYAREKTLSIHEVDSLPRELCCWVAILTTFALGTAAGDWFAEGLQLGYAYSALVFGGAIALVYAAHKLFSRQHRGLLLDRLPPHPAAGCLAG